MTDEDILPILDLCPQSEVEKYTEPNSEDDDYDNEVERLVFEDLEEDSCQTSDVSTDGCSPKKKPG